MSSFLLFCLVSPFVSTLRRCLPLFRVASPVQQLSVPLGHVRSSSRGTSVSLRHLRHLYSVFISEFVLFVFLFLLFGSARVVVFSYPVR